jgi:hypothetical protein
MKLAMLTSVGLAVVAAAALASQSATAPRPEESGSPRSCCAKKSADAPMKCEKPATTTGDTSKHAGHEGHKMRCSLTGKVVDTCCCVEREGKTHCTLADKDVAECCCTPVKEEKSASAKAN